MKIRTEQILAIMNVVAWVTFIGLSIQTGATIISYVVSIGNPEAAKNLYMGQNLYTLRQFDFRQYTFTVSFIVALLMLKAHIAQLVINLLSKIKLSNPFTVEISNLLEKISYYILGLWITAMLSSAYSAWLIKKITDIPDNRVSGEFILLAGVVFVISHIFKKGVEIQSENELTV